MTKTQVEQINKEFEYEQNKLKSISIGDIVYITDCWGDFFECVVKSINLDNGTLTVEDKSLCFLEPLKENRTKEISAFYTKPEAEAFWKTDYYKFKPF